MSDLTSIVYAPITNIFSFKGENDGSDICQVTLGPGLKVMARNCKEADFPANGLLVAWELRAVGKGCTLVRWGIPRLANGTKAGEPLYLEGISPDWKFVAPTASRSGAATW